MFVSSLVTNYRHSCRTVCVTRKRAGADKVWKREKLKARKMPEKRADSHLSGARIVRRTHRTPTILIHNEHQTHLENILPVTKTFAITKKDFDLPKHLPSKFSIN